MRPEQQQVLDDPIRYTGQSASRTIAVCEHWRREAEKVRVYLAQEKTALSTLKADRFEHLYNQQRNVERGEPLPSAFCPAEDRRLFIETLH
jgi:hypothetical protein